ncbi:MAG: hypothetical protein K6E77_10785 [Lachnospiraceae bacterium]|nr:hypothetical protein [Lachnospiraceae bacterium]
MAGAVLDVLNEPLSKDSRLWTVPNLLITPLQHVVDRNRGY